MGDSFKVGRSYSLFFVFQKEESTGNRNKRKTSQPLSEKYTTIIREVHNHYQRSTCRLFVCRELQVVSEACNTLFRYGKHIVT